MARTPDYVRLAATASRTLVEAAFDSVREAVLIVDTRRKHMPVVLANASARRYLAAGPDPQALLESSLYGLLSAVSASMIEGVLAAVPEGGEAALTRSLAWRFSRGESTVATELKRLDSSPGQRLVMLTFAVGPLGRELALVADQLPFNLLVLDSSLSITYANCGAAQSSGVAGSPIGCSALRVAPTSALPREVFQRGLGGCHFHHDAVESEPPLGPRRRFEIDIQPLRGPAGIVGLIVLTSEVGERRIARTPESVGERHLRALMAHAQDTISVASADGRLLYVSSSGAKHPADYASSDTSYIFDFLVSRTQRRCVPTTASWSPERPAALPASIASGVKTVPTAGWSRATSPVSTIRSSAGSGSSRGTLPSARRRSFSLPSARRCSGSQRTP